LLTTRLDLLLLLLQFVGIVQAEELWDDKESDAHILRLTKHARPLWWSDAPNSVMDV
jgi:hypothetical protein